MRSPYAIILCLLFFSHILSAQPGSYLFKHISVNDGLSHNEVLCFYKDTRGFIWIGTASGLNRYDGYNIKVYQHNSRDSSSVSSNGIQRLFELPDQKMGVLTSDTFNVYDPVHERFQTGIATFYKKYNLPADRLNNVWKDEYENFWFNTVAHGMVHYDHVTHKTFPLQHGERDSLSLATARVRSWTSAGDNQYWLIHANGILEKIALSNNGYKVVKRISYFNTINKGMLFDYRLQKDKDGDLWIFVADNKQGIYKLDHATGSIAHFTSGTQNVSLSTDLVRDIVVDNNGLIWVATDHGGINIIRKHPLAVQRVLHSDDDARSLGQNSVNTLYKDSEGIIWAGTYKKGVSYYHENIIRFPVYRHIAGRTDGLPYADVNRFVEDKSGNLWIGTNGGGLLYFNRSNGTFAVYRHSDTNSNTIGSDVIVSLCVDHENVLWIGTYYGGLTRYDGKKFIRYQHQDNDPASLASQNVWEIFEDSQRRLWIGTLNGGLDLFDRQKQTFSHYRASDPNSIQGDYISAITEDREGNLWIGTTSGVDILSHDRGRFIHYESEAGNSASLSNNNVYDIREDSQGRVWIGTADGLSLFNKRSKTFRTFTTASGLPHNAILTVLEDREKNIWLSTPNGLSRVTLAGDSLMAVVNFGEAEGLQGKQFNENAAYKTSRDELIFGGANGFNIFVPARFGINKNVPAVVLTDFQLFNTSVKTGEVMDNKVLLPESITEVKAITLAPDKNVFSLEFAALNFFHPERNVYQYKLEGFDENWLTADSKSRRVTFTNLDPGDYVFNVRASNNDGVWNNIGTSLKITVLPPFWKTKTAFVLYFLAIIGALFLTRSLIQQREKMKFAIQQERQEAMRMHELDMMKIKFFTNVSHEFRTPLTLILTPLEKMLRQSTEPEQQSQFQLIQRNARRLLNLVNQLLDFRKMEVQEIKFNPSEGDIIHFIRETVYSFSDLSEKKNIRLGFASSIASVETLFDQDKLEKILFNLLSNAFKFTPEGGEVTVQVDMTQEDSGRSIIIHVKDTGIGVPFDKQDRIFERFFQNDLPASMVNQGSGIGLSITKEFVKIHGGTITLASEPGAGSSFIVTLPLREVTVHHEAPAVEMISMPLIDIPEDEETTGVHKPVLLLVEDNEDFRFYLKDNLKLQYKVMEASNGKEGWKKVQELLPDLIVSDVMMPEMNGIELCRKVKTDARVSHIPVILLTARAAEEQKVEGFNVGANDYITKPFNFEILASRIQNLIVQREKFHKIFARHLDVKASELVITPLDEKFIQNAIKCVEDNVSRDGFSVEDMSHELGISRAHLYKKILALTGKAPLEFIRTIRLQQAAQLLEKSQLTVAEIAYRVGFNNPKYFARYFKEAYSVLPSAYAAGKRAGNPDS